MLVISSNIFLVLSLHAVFRPYVNRLHIFKHLKLCLMSCKHPRNVGVLARRQDAVAGRRAVSRPDSPAEVQLSHGSDGQVHTDEVAVRLVFVGAGDRVSGLEPKTEKKPIYILYLLTFLRRPLRNVSKTGETADVLCSLDVRRDAG